TPAASTLSYVIPRETRNLFAINPPGRRFLVSLGMTEERLSRFKSMAHTNPFTIQRDSEYH
ncbi:MAG: hypothetical protein ACPGWR_05895, partial [Ardenticatenaceae bacterium]